MTFSEYLVSKKIDEAGFETHEPEWYQKWSLEFPQMHADSFTARYKFFLNPIRRKYPLPIIEKPTATNAD